jgi:hypothetical protein
MEKNNRPACSGWQLEYIIVAAEALNGNKPSPLLNGT